MNFPFVLDQNLVRKIYQRKPFDWLHSCKTRRTTATTSQRKFSSFFLHKKLHSISSDWKCNYESSKSQVFWKWINGIMAKHCFIFSRQFGFFSSSFSCRWLTLRHFWMSVASGMGERVSRSTKFHWSVEIKNESSARQKQLYLAEIEEQSIRCMTRVETLTCLTGFLSAISESKKRHKNLLLI